MRIVNSTPNVLKENLASAIQEVVSDFKENYHISNHNPDFSRKRVQDIARYTEPVRPGRRDERNIKAKTFVGFIYRVSA